MFPYDKINMNALIRTERYNHGYRLQDVADATGMSFSYVSRLESDERKKLSLDIAWRLLRFFDLTHQDLLHYMNDVTHDDRRLAKHLDAWVNH